MWSKFVSRPKEQDDFIDLLRHWILVPQFDMTLSVDEAVNKMQALIDQHVVNPEDSELKRQIPHLGRLSKPLDLVRALAELDAETRLTHRRFVPPTFSEMRVMFNYATVHQVSQSLQLLTFDADETLYRTGHCLQPDDWIITAFISMMRAGLTIAIVTAAGYPGHVEKYELRLGAVLLAMKLAELPEECRRRFFVMGGQCNYLCRVNDSFNFEFIPPEQWRLPEMQWDEAKIVTTLDAVEAVLREAIARLDMPAVICRKERTVGFVSNGPKLSFNNLEDIVLGLNELEPLVPICPFNGGEDVFVDIGDKSYGVKALQAYLQVPTDSTLHFGDGFYGTGNDRRVRATAHTMWVANPTETAKLVSMILEDMRSRGVDVISSGPPVVLAHSYLL